jgi:tetratricopeptide (TPR) repeat protein
VEGAVEKYREALVIDSSISSELGNPESRAKGIAVQSLIDWGDNLARDGDVEGAIEKYSEALIIDPSVSSDLGDPESRAREIGIISEIYNLISSGEYHEASVKLSVVMDTYPDLKEEIDTYYLNFLCWDGSLNGFAEDVKDACELLGELTPDHGGHIDSRGLNRAILDDFQGAIEDFDFAVQWFIEQGYPETIISKRKAWLDSLKEGVNPFDQKTLEELRNE